MNKLLDTIHKLSFVDYFFLVIGGILVSIGVWSAYVIIQILVKLMV